MPRRGGREDTRRRAARAEPVVERRAIELRRSRRFLRMVGVDPARERVELVVERTKERKLVVVEVRLEPTEPRRGAADADAELRRDGEEPLVRVVERLATGVKAVPPDLDPPRSPADPLRRLEDEDVYAFRRQPVRRRESRQAGTDDEHAPPYQTPPSATVIVSPFTPLASSVARKTITAATSAGSSTRPAG